MRNKTEALTEAQFQGARAIADTLEVGTLVTLHYGKREDKDYDGRITGSVVSVKLVPDTTGHVKVDSDRGPRTISLHLIREVI